MIRIVVGVLFLIPTVALATVKAPDFCSTPIDVATTVVKPVDIPKLKENILKIKFTNSSEPIAFKDPEKLSLAIEQLFDHRQPTSKLSQFFNTLYVLGEHIPFSKTLTEGHFDMPTVRKAMVIGGVFPNEEFPQKIQGVKIRPVHSNTHNQYEFQVSYGAPQVKLPLNEGKGFGAKAHGKCQHAQALIFYKDFSFRTRMGDHRHLIVYDMENVDIFGDFGSRGIVNVDVNYVSLMRIEFFHQSDKGKVRSRPSNKEFEVNEHTWLLKLVSRLIPDNSVQAMDW